MCDCSFCKKEKLEHAHWAINCKQIETDKKQIQITAGMTADQKVETIYSDSLEQRDGGEQDFLEIRQKNLPFTTTYFLQHYIYIMGGPQKKKPKG